MIIAAGIFTESMAVDLGVLGTILSLIGGGFAWVIGMLKSMKESRSDEIETAISKIINASPDKIVVNPQPLIVKMQEEFVTHVNLDQRLSDLNRRVGVLEGHRESDKKELLDRIDGIPGRVIATLKDVWGMKK